MQDDFWGSSGRLNWWEPEPKQKMFLGNFFVEIGKISHGESWLGATSKPNHKESESIKKEIAQAAAGGDVETFVLDRKSHEYQPIDCAQWRNPKVFASRFSRCMIHTSDTENVSPSGEHHGYIYVNCDQALKYLDNRKSKIPNAAIPLKPEYLSTYLRYMIFTAQQAEIDFGNPPSKKSLAGKLLSGWITWRRQDANVKILPSEAILSERMASGMASILGGELARAEKMFGTKKKTRTILANKNKGI